MDNTQALYTIARKLFESIADYLPPTTLWNYLTERHGEFLEDKIALRETDGKFKKLCQIEKEIRNLPKKEPQYDPLYDPASLTL